MEVVNSVAPTAIAGAATGLNAFSETTPEERTAKTTKVLEYAIVGQLALGVLAYAISHASVVGIATAVATKGLVGGAFTTLYNKSGASEELADGLRATVEKTMKPSDSATWRALKGGGVGVAAGAWESGKVGFKEGKGMVSGLLDAVERLPGAVKTRIMKLIKSRKLPDPVMLTAGAIGGAVGAAINAGVGMAHGFWDALDHKIEAANHRRAVLTQSAVAGAATGAILGGALGMGVGAGIGAALGWGLSKLSKALGADERITRRVQRQLEHVDGEAEESGDQVTDTYRDALRSMAVGLVAGAEAGWDEGRHHATRAVKQAWQQLGGLLPEEKPKESADTEPPR